MHVPGSLIRFSARSVLSALVLAAALLPAGTGTGRADTTLSAIGPEIRAQLSPRQSTVLSSEIAGKLAELPLRDGERFEKGDILAVIDCALNRTRLDQIRATRDKLQRVHETKVELNRLRSIGLLDVDVAAAELAQAESELAYMDLMVQRCVLRAPFGGRVSGVLAKRYQFVAEGEPLVEILNDRELEVEMIVPSRWIARVQPGTAFRVELEETGKLYPARIARLSGRVDPVSQSIRVYGEIAGDHPELMAGMSGRALLDPAMAEAPPQAP